VNFGGLFPVFLVGSVQVLPITGSGGLVEDDDDIVDFGGRGGGRGGAGGISGWRSSVGTGVDSSSVERRAGSDATDPSGWVGSLSCRGSS
jgi:hypothetical protein